ncbi:peptide ABC transporter substrate-binding protein [Haloferula sp. BvORR071]|uniref:peptide ABC transporter substrate-binding protein n=1 Tax=Haloferula sp. BvORR071 TaxID=1396141 RepID=UPI0006965AE8|nr:peptide ABC transporter substrate-binding protein [Haloferula sp. BvORR071]
MTRCTLLLLPALLCLASCQRETQVEKANREKIFIVGNANDPKALDPHLVTGVIEHNIIRALLEGLVAEDPESDTGYPPGAATSWEHNADFTEWTFHLRPDGKWSDGAPLTSADFDFAYHRLLHPDLAGPYAEMLYFIKNAEAFNKGEITDWSQVGVATPDDYTLKITMREPVPFLLGMTRHYTWFPVPRHVILRFGKMTDRFTKWSEAGNYVGNGPFVLKEWRFNDKVETVKNPLYWNAAHVKLNGVRFVPVENFYTETRGFLAGQLHTTYQLPPPLVEKIRAEHPEFLRQEPYLATDFIRTNITRPVLDNPKVRMAMSLAIDRKQLCDNILQGNTPCGTITPDLGDYHPDQIVSFDPERAKALLAEAGYPGGKGVPRFKILMSSTGSRATIEALQAMWKDTLGILVDPQPKDWGSYVTAQQKLDYDIALAAWTGDYLDPSTFLLMWTKGNGNNNTGWSNEEFERLLSEAAHQSDEKQRLEFFKKAERILIEEQPILPISYRGRNYLLRPEVKGWHKLLLDNHPWAEISLEP